MRKWLVLLCGMLVQMSLMAAAPAVIWYSEPVMPGEAVMVFGGPWNKVDKVELSGLGKQTVKPIKVTSECVTFVYPENWPLTSFDAKIIDTSGSVSINVNEADAWWIQAQQGKYIYPGSMIRILGRCIGYDNKTAVELRSKSKKLKVKVIESDLYSAAVQLPEDLQLGDYEVYLSNGIDKDYVLAGNIKVTAEIKYPGKVFNIVDYGAIPNDRIDDSREINAALADIAKNNGGVLYVPRGRFGMQGQMILPPNTILRGEDMALSQIYWLDTDFPADPLLSGKYNFGIEDIYLVSGNFFLGISLTRPAKGDIWKNENIFMRNVRINFLHTDSIDGEEDLRRFRQKSKVIDFEGENIVVEDCNFVATKGGIGIHGDYVVVRNNRVRGATKNQAMWFNGRRVIIENNDFTSTGCSFSNNSRFFYLHNNQMGSVFGDGDRETFTFDGGGGTYSDKLFSAKGRKVKLKKFGWRHGKDHWIGRSIYIIGGKGVGQMRLITATGNNEVEVDREWDIMPDKTSHMVIAEARNNLLFIDNSVYDGNPFQYYGCAINCVLSGNKVYRNGGMPVYGMFKGFSPEPSWFIQLLGNEIMEGNAVRGPWSYLIPANDSYLAFFDRGIRKPLTYSQARVGVMRKNILHSNAYIYVGRRVKGALVENNLVKDADRGLKVDTDTAVVRGNRFEKVIDPYQVNSKVEIAEAEFVTGALQAAEATLGEYLPEDWSKYAEQVKRNPQKAKQILEAALVSLSVKVGNNEISSATVKALTGLDMSQRSTWLFSKLASGKETKLYLGSFYPSWSVPAKLTAELDSFNGWKMRLVCPEMLEPGKNARASLYITPGDGVNAPFTMQAKYKISGNGWSFNFKDDYKKEHFSIDQFLVVGPFKNTSGEKRDSNVHPPEIDPDVTRTYETAQGKFSWQAVSGDKKGKIDLDKLFSKPLTSTAHAVAVVRTTKAMKVLVNYGRNVENYLFVNGKRVGSSARREAVLSVYLKKGDNLFKLITSHGSGKWPLDIKLTVVDPVKPGDISCLSTSELFKSPLLLSKGGKIPVGKGLPHSLGVDWKLLVNDKFDRFRLGNGWKCESPGWMSQKPSVLKGQLVPEARWGFLTYDKDITTPVRIEFDMLYVKNMAGVILCPEGLAWRSFWGRGKNGMSGNGYCMTVGWHNQRNNRIIRDDMTVMLDEKTPVLEEGETYRIMAQFVPPMCQMYVDGKLYMEYEDPEFLSGLNRIGVFAFGKATFDNLRIYTGNMDK